MLGHTLLAICGLSSLPLPGKVILGLCGFSAIYIIWDVTRVVTREMRAQEQKDLTRKFNNRFDWHEKNESPDSVMLTEV